MVTDLDAEIGQPTIPHVNIASDDDVVMGTMATLLRERERRAHRTAAGHPPRAGDRRSSHGGRGIDAYASSEARGDADDEDLAAKDSKMRTSSSTSNSRIEGVRAKQQGDRDVLAELLSSQIRENPNEQRSILGHMQELVTNNETETTRLHERIE